MAACLPQLANLRAREIDDLSSELDRCTGGTEQRDGRGARTNLMEPLSVACDFGQKDGEPRSERRRSGGLRVRSPADQGRTVLVREPREI